MKRKNGYILVLTLSMMAGILFFAFSYVEFFRIEQRIARSGEADLIAGASASAGIDQAIYELKRNLAWTVGFNQFVLPYSGASYTLNFGPNLLGIPYSTNNSLGTLSIRGYGGRIILPGMVDLISAGRHGNAMRVEEALVSGTTGVIVIRARW